MSKKRKEKQLKVPNIIELSILYGALDLILAELEHNKVAGVKDGKVFFLDDRKIKDKSLRMMKADVGKIMDVLYPYEDYLELAKKRYSKVFDDFHKSRYMQKENGGWFSIFAGYRMLELYSLNKDFKILNFHKNRVEKVLTQIKKEAKIYGTNEELRFLSSGFLNSLKLGELFYKKILGAI